MSKEENILTKRSPFSIMQEDIEAIADELAFGQFEYPCKTHKTMTFIVHNHLVSEIQLHFRDDNGIYKTKRYRAD